VTSLEALVVVSSVLAGIVGGVFFAFSVFVMRALAQLAPAAGISAMQRINITVIHPLFLGTFLGTVPLLAISVYFAYTSGHTHMLAWLLGSFLVYTLGSVGVTLTLNVPRNNRLAGMKHDSSAAVAYWPVYVREWLFWNHVRCTASIAAATAAAIALSAARASAPIAA
jgi:uncharacterized membrane protein